MTVAHTTLLEFLGKKITYDLAVDQSFDSSGYIQESGTVTGVLLELDGDHQLCIKLDGYTDSHEFVKFSEIKLKS
ncbi:hypothetical protein D7V64_17240 [Acinetobacter cumulans]|uniref:Uncharacterized protein n=1 Tax=Acinetobacter cumulans TaxID=2136182 RepID=A0A3A8FJ73_9GAMM|nr:hypothetical protein [Acinetobacter cumulans]RKG47027.1 hypothetical protein D7V64_17240 [Acinetobacter cumulans]